MWCSWPAVARREKSSLWKRQVIFLVNLVGLLLLAAACAGIGLAESRKLRDRAVLLESFRKFLTVAEAEIHYGLVPVGELVLSCRQQGPLLEDCARRLEQGSRFPEAWQGAVKRWGGPDQAFLAEFCRGLGATGLEGQLSHFQLYRELARTRLEEARRDQEKKGKLYRQLGVFGGLALALVLW